MKAGTLVVCVGNTLVGDDAAGCAVFAALAARPPPGARLVLLELGGLALVDQLEGEETLIVVDAVLFGARPGTVHVVDGGALPGRDGPAVSAHGIGIRDAVSVARHLVPERAPSRVVLVGVEGRIFDRVGPMSPDVSRAVASAAEAVRAACAGREPQQPQS